jgi:hypothetical protein
LQLGLRTGSLLPLGLFLIFASTSPRAATWRVHADGTGDLPTIQEAINGAASGDTIRVGPGDYSANLWIEGKAIILLSDQGPTATILHGLSLQDSPVIDVFYDDGNQSIIEGFTIRDGTTGIRATSASPVIRGNTIMHNESALGAGICCTFGSNAVIDGNLIVHNRTWYQCCFPSRGGGVYADETSAAIIRNNVIAYNTCDGECIGGGVSVFVATVERNTIFGNHADGPAGGIELPFDGAVVSNNIVCGNDSGEFGDGIVVFRNATLYCNDVFANGDEDYWGAEPGPGDFSADPRFCGLPNVGADSGPLRLESFDLQTDSPCLPEQHPGGADCDRIGARGATCKTTPFPVRTRIGGLRPSVMVFPNPTRAGAAVRFDASPSGHGTAVEIVTAGGRLLRRIESTSPGLARWDGRDAAGHPVSAGLYYVRVLSGPLPQRGTILVIR